MRHAMTMLTVISPACSEVQSTHSRPSAIHLPGWMVHRAPPHPGHLAAGWPPDVGPDPPPRAAAYRPDTALVNYYDPGLRPWGGAVRSRLLMPYAAFAAAKAAGASRKDRTPGNPTPRPGQNLRIHHDNGESISDLAVSLSLGDRCSFRLSNAGNHGYPCTDLTLSSGDTLVFGRQARFACHDEPRNGGAPHLPRHRPSRHRPSRHRPSRIRPHPRPHQHHNAHHRARRSVSPETAEFTRCARRTATPRAHLPLPAVRPWAETGLATG
jgi:2OG-Fe(II) oxygenase superfamily